MEESYLPKRECSRLIPKLCLRYIHFHQSIRSICYNSGDTRLAIQRPHVAHTHYLCESDYQVHVARYTIEEPSASLKMKYILILELQVLYPNLQMLEIFDKRLLHGTHFLYQYINLACMSKTHSYLSAYKRRQKRHEMLHFAKFELLSGCANPNN